MSRAFGFLAALWCLSAGGAAAAAELRLELTDLKPGGRVSVGVFRTETDWKGRTGAVWTEIQPVAGTTVRLSRNLPPGEYAVMVYHDRNENGRLDTSALGPPTEPVGFSNNSRGRFGPPAWPAASFRLPPAGATQVIRLR